MINSYFFKRILLLFVVVFGLFFGVIFLKPANSMETISANETNLGKTDTRVFELLRLHVSENGREAWLNAEKASWEPWLAKQSGFLGRELFWEKEKEEALLLISWASRDKWKAIPQEDIDNVQNLFERFARQGTGQKSGNPFPLISEGELVIQ